MKFEEPEEKDQQVESRVRSHKKSKMRLRRILLLCGVFLIGLLAYNAVALMKFFDHANQNKFAELGNEVQVTKWNGNDKVNILLMGVDNRDKDTAPRSDTMLLLSFNPDTKHATLLSIMRDSYVNVPGHGQSKINAAFAIGGPDLTVKTVEDYLQIPIHYYIVTDFKGFEGVVDAIGGIDMNVEIPMNHPDDGVYDIHLNPGMQHLTGKEALQYVRYRGDARSDFARTERQRKFLKEVFKAMKTPLSIVRFPSMLEAAEPYVQTNLKPSDIARLSTDMLRIDTTGLKSIQVPPDDMLTETTDFIGESILLPNVDRVRQFVKTTLDSDSDSANHQDPSTPVSSTPVGNSSGAVTQPGNNSSGGASSGNSNGTGTPLHKNPGELTGTVNEGANVRQQAGTNYPIVTTVSPGQEFAIVKQEGDWYKVRLQDDTVGYIFGQLVTVNTQ